MLSRCPAFTSTYLSSIPWLMMLRVLWDTQGLLKAPVSLAYREGGGGGSSWFKQCQFSALPSPCVGGTIHSCSHTQRNTTIPGQHNPDTPMTSCSHVFSQLCAKLTWSPHFINLLQRVYMFVCDKSIQAAVKSQLSWSWDLICKLYSYSQKIQAVCLIESIYVAALTLLQGVNLQSKMFFMS